MARTPGRQSRVGSARRKDFRGTVTAEADGEISATVIRLSSDPQEFATLPVTELVP